MIFFFFFFFLMCLRWQRQKKIKKIKNWCSDDQTYNDLHRHQRRHHLWLGAAQTYDDLPKPSIPFFFSFFPSTPNIHNNHFGSELEAQTQNWCSDDRTCDDLHRQRRPNGFCEKKKKKKEEEEERKNWMECSEDQRKKERKKKEK